MYLCVCTNEEFETHKVVEAAQKLQEMVANLADYTLEEIIGKPYEDLIHSPDRSHTENYRRRRKGRDLVIIGDLGRALACAGGERGGREKKDGNGRQSAHWALSLDQLMAWT